MSTAPSVRIRSVLLALCTVPFVQAQTAGTALVRHGPTINGPVDGSVRQMVAEDAKVNSGGSVTGDLLVPGTPTVVLNSAVTYAGTVDATGSALPSGYKITLGSGTSLRHVVRRNDANDLPFIATPPAPTGTIDVTVSSGSQPLNFATIRNLTLGNGVGQITVPPGTYGKLTANGATFVFGTAGANIPSVYNLQQLTLNSASQLQVVGPVIVNVNGNVVLAGPAGSPSNLSWLQLNVANGDVTLNNNGAFYGYATAPAGAVVLNSTSQFVGGSISDKLTVGSGGSLHLVDQPPAVSITVPASGVVFSAPASFVLTAEASDPDGTIAKVEFIRDAVTLGEATAPPYQFAVNGLGAGSYIFTAKASDDAGLTTTSAPVTVLVDAPPAIAITAPADGAAFVSPASILLLTSVSDADGSVAKVEFFEGANKIGESVTAPYQLAWASVNPGIYTLTAKATDDAGFSTISLPITLQVNPPAAPGISFNPPPGGAVLASPASITLSANAVDPNGGTITKVDFYLGSTLIGTTTSPSSASPSTFTFRAPNPFPPGVYAFTARATNSYGLSATTPWLTISVLASLPYGTDFEASENYTLGPISGQLGWSLRQGAGAVTNSDAFHGAQSAILNAGTPRAQLEQTFAPAANETIVFFDFFAKPVAEATADASTSFDVEGARFAFVLNGAAAILNIYNASGNGGAGQWAPTRFVAPVGADNRLQSWIRLTVRLDFIHKTWDLYAGGQMVAADVILRDITRSYLSTFLVQGDAATATLLDDIFAGSPNTLFTDANNDGIDDAWETRYGLSLATNDRYLSPAGNGLTVVQAYINGTDPNDYYQGSPPTITPVSGGNGQAGPQGLVTVRLTAADGTVLANAPVTIATTNTGSLIASSPTGPTSASLTLRTDSQGIAAFYLSFTTYTSQTLSITGGGRSLSLLIKPPLTDSDGNGLPDLWEVTYFGHIGNNPTADPDGDGATNLQEFTNGTDPGDYYNGVLPQMTSLIGPDGALAPDNSIQLKITDALGNPLANAPVTFRAQSGGHQLSATIGGTPANQIDVRTDATGVAKAYVISGSN